MRAVLSEEHSLQQWLEIIIILWHSKSWWNQSYPQDSDVSTIVRTHYLIWLKRYPQDWSHTRLPDLVKNGTIYSWHNLTASIQIKYAPPLSINWSMFEALGYDTLNNLKELLFCQNHPRALRTSNTTWTHIQIQDSSFSFCQFIGWTLEFCIKILS